MPYPQPPSAFGHCAGRPTCALPIYWTQLTAAARRIDPAKIYIDDTPSASLQQIRSKCRQWRSDRQIFVDQDPAQVEAPKGLVIIDYLQLMQALTSTGRAMESRERGTTTSE